MICFGQGWRCSRLLQLYWPYLLLFEWSGLEMLQITPAVLALPAVSCSKLLQLNWPYRWSGLVVVTQSFRLGAGSSCWLRSSEIVDLNLRLFVADVAWVPAAVASSGPAKLSTDFQTLLGPEIE
jgi:hypothetical protein